MGVVNSFLGSESYFFTDDHGINSFFSISSQDFRWRYYSEYNKNYLLLILLLRNLKEVDVKNFIVNNSTRIVEEINGDISPLNEWGRSVLRYIYRNLLPYFVDFSFRKQSKEIIFDNIQKGKVILECKHSKGYDDVVNDIRRRRIKRFQHEFQKK